MNKEGTKVKDPQIKFSVIVEKENSLEDEFNTTKQNGKNRQVSEFEIVKGVNKLRHAL